VTAAAKQRAPFRFRLDAGSGIPVYRQIMDQVTGGMASGTLNSGDQLPTVRQLAVDLSINPNTVIRAYRELEIRGVLDTQQGTGTFIGSHKGHPDEVERRRQLNQLTGEFVARAGALNFTVDDLIDVLRDLRTSNSNKRK
jgi:GntR family transcriptional regulator